MNDIPCRERLFPYRISAATFYAPYLRWLKHLGERLGIRPTLSIWKNTFTEYDDALLMTILSSGWQKPISAETNTVESIKKLITATFSTTSLEVSNDEIMGVIEITPPIPQIRAYFSNHTMEKESTAFEALHLRFDGLAYVAEMLIERYGKQGELIVYDILVAERLAATKNKAGSVAEFIEDFTAEECKPSLFTAGLKTELISKTHREAVVFVRECEWARYFQERHPSVGYLMACSTDEAAYKAFNSRLRMQRTRTLMEGGDLCDFRVYTIDKELNSEGQTEH
jgi:hypothetical protein